MIKSRVVPLLLMVISMTWMTESSSLAIAQEVPKARQVIEEYVEALGGEMFLDSLSSFKLTCRYTSGDFFVHFHEGTLHWNASRGKNNYWLDSKGRFWARNSGTLKLRDDVTTGYPNGFVHLPVWALDWLDEDSIKVTNLGSRQLGDRETWCLKFEAEGLEPCERYFDQETGLLLQTSMSDRNYSYDHGELDGTLFPTRVTIGKYGEGGSVLEMKEIEFDPDHEGIDFSFPEELKPKLDDSTSDDQD